uniref:Putative nucleic-acid-binding protein from mobile element jockey-like dufourea novaeangliae n=1 Tax=Lutzomyia longipalpis TaxID=7200 RepID=A0A1B0CLL1_LUTLO
MSSLDTSFMDLTDDENHNNDNNEWTLSTRKTTKRGRVSPENCKGRPPLKQTKLHYWLGIPTQNKFSSFTRQEEATTSGESNESEPVNSEQQTQPNGSSEPRREPKPPPIFVHKVGRIPPLINLLKDLAPNKHTVKALRDDQVKIQADSADTYRTILKALKEKERRTTGTENLENLDQNFPHLNGVREQPVSYASAASEGRSQDQGTDHGSSNFAELKNMMKGLMNQMADVMRLITIVVTKLNSVHFSRNV